MNIDDKAMTDFCDQVIKLKAKGFFVENMCDVYGPQFDGQYRWMNSVTLAFQDDDVSYTEVEAWVDCVKCNPQG